MPHDHDGDRLSNDYVPTLAGRPCEHREYMNTDRCGEMNCSNYAMKHGRWDG